jgi:uncharacterized DUF497 family protein
MDFASLDLSFFAEAVVVPAKLGRFKAVGIHRGDGLAVIFKPLGTEAISVISMRRASTNERKLI